MVPLLIFLVYALMCDVGETNQIDDIPEFQYLNESVDPCDNFYQFTCGNFKNVHPLPEKQQSLDHFSILQEEIHAIAKDILHNERTLDDPQALHKAKAFYISCINAPNLAPQANGYHSHVEVLTKLRKWPAITKDYNMDEPKLSWTELAHISSDYGLSFLFSFSVEPALLDPTANVIFIQKDNLHYPDASGVRSELPRDFTKYLSISLDADEENNNGYLEFLTNVAFHMRNLTNERATDAQVKTQLKETIEFIANVSTNKMEDDESIPSLTAEPTVKQLQNWTDTIFGEKFMDWATYLNIHVGDGNTSVTESTKVLHNGSSTLYNILIQYQLASAVQLKNYVIARLMTLMAPDGDRLLIDTWKNFSVVNNDAVYDRDEYCVRKTLGYKENIGFSLAVTYEYQAYYFNRNKFKKADHMVSKVHNMFLDILKESEWMDDESKEKAIAKAKKLITLLGYPEEIIENNSKLNEFHDDMRVCSWDHFGNAQRMRVFGLTKNLKPITSQKKRDLWTISPLEVNALYNRGNNRVLIPISILNAVFFSGEDIVLDYARLGAIIGHEITHGFDKSGKDYNSEGTFDPKGWTANTLKKFEERAGCFEQQYSQYNIAEIGEYVNGAQTLNENIADNGGLRTAYKTWRKLVDVKGSKVQIPTTSKYTPEQLFFIAFGTMWCTEESYDYLKKMNEIGSYPPGRFRVIGPVSNMPEFADAFKCPLGSNMNPTEKCQLW